MPPELKAIETQYKGYRFRSRLEARWAVFFDALGLKWEYEVEGYELANGSRYLPDFYLPERLTFVEIKGAAPSAGELEKAAMLRQGARLSQNVVLFSGSEFLPPSFMALADGAVARRDGTWGVLFFKSWRTGQVSQHPTYWAHCAQCTAEPYFAPLGIQHATVHDAVSHEQSPGEVSHRWWSVSPMLDEAYKAARGARFEFGESGAPRPELRPHDYENNEPDVIEAARSAAQMTNDTSSGEGLREAQRTFVLAARSFKQGDIVYHRSFGQGTVVDTKQWDSDVEVHVAFAGSDTRKLMQSFAQLEKVALTT